MSEWACFQTAFETRLKQDEKRFRRKKISVAWVERLGSSSSDDAKSAAGLVGLPTRYSYPTGFRRVRVMGFIAVR